MGWEGLSGLCTAAKRKKKLAQENCLVVGGFMNINMLSIQF